MAKAAARQTAGLGSIPTRRAFLLKNFLVYAAQLLPLANHRPNLAQIWSL